MNVFINCRNYPWDDATANWTDDIAIVGRSKLNEAGTIKECLLGMGQVGLWVMNIFLKVHHLTHDNLAC